MPKGPHGQHIQYMVDYFYPDNSKFDGFREDTIVVKVLSEAEAINEAKAVDIRKKSHHFHVRVVTRKSNTIIYKSEVS